MPKTQQTLTEIDRQLRRDVSPPPGVPAWRECGCWQEDAFWEEEW
ncbi:MAG: hypothetical protein OXI69_16615 [Acidobacteriota bacterium]|nr:hypothetical protein [Acidobacteriota bacterium]